MAMASENSGEINYFFDISALLEYVGQFERYSGIQRVVATVICRFAARPGAERLYLSHVARGGEILCLDFADLGAAAFDSPARMRAAFFPPEPGATELCAPLAIAALERYRHRPFSYYFHRARLDAMYALGQDRPFRRFGLAREDWPEARRPAPSPSRPRPLSMRPLRDVARPGDRMILLDSSWQHRHSAAFAQARKSGLRLYPFVHDLIPLVAAPSVEKGEVTRLFYDWLRDSADYADGYLANSRATAADLREFLAAHQVSTPVVAIPLAQSGVGEPRAAGDGLPPAARRLYPVASEAIDLRAETRAMALSPYVLCVGTIEARKNVWRLLLAWKSLIDQGHYDLPKLALAGRKGWLSRDVEDFLAGTGHLAGFVQLIEQPSDAELAFLYRHCVFGAMVSLYEGWGLPVGEALAYGKTSVVARAGALPEAGGELVEYCDPLAVPSIAEAVWRLWSEPGRRQALEAKIAATRLRSWDDVAADLLAALR